MQRIKLNTKVLVSTHQHPRAKNSVVEVPVDEAKALVAAGYAKNTTADLTDFTAEDAARPGAATVAVRQAPQGDAADTDDAAAADANEAKASKKK